MKLITVIFAFGLMAGPALAQTGTGKSGGVSADAQGLGGGKSTDTQPAAEEVVSGSDANRTIENLASPVDPAGDPAGWFDTLVTYWKAGYFLPFAFALALGLVTFSAKYVPWIGETPKRALAAAALTTFLGEFVIRLGTGAPLTVAIVLAALGAAYNTWTSGGMAASRAADGKAAKFGAAS